jgi:hypothetical protein
MADYTITEEREESGFGGWVHETIELARAAAPPSPSTTFASTSAVNANNE